MSEEVAQTPPSNHSVDFPPKEAQQFAGEGSDTKLNQLY